MPWRERTRQVVGTILDLHLLLVGSAACGLLAFNPTFVRLWVGPELYGGDQLNVWLVAGLIVAIASVKSASSFSEKC